MSYLEDILGAIDTLRRDLHQALDNPFNFIDNSPDHLVLAQIHIRIQNEATEI